MLTYCAWSQHVNEQWYKRITSNYTNRIESNCYINFDSVYTLSRQLINLAKDNNDILRQLYAVANICWNAEWANRPDILKVFLKTGEELLKSHSREILLHDTTGLYRSMVMSAIGTHYYNLGNYAAAMDRFAQIINFGGRPLTNDSSMLRSSCYYMGQMLFILGRLDQAMQYFDLGTRYIMKHEEDYNYHWSMYYMYSSEYLFSINEIEKARALLKKSIDVLIKDPRKEFIRNSLKSNYQLMRNYYKTRKDIDSSVFFMNKAIGLFRKNDIDFVSGYKEFGDIYFEGGFLDSALYYYQRSLALSQRANNQYWSTAQAGIANVQREYKQFNTARELYDKSLLPLVSGNRQLLSNVNLNNSADILLPMETMEILADKAQMYYDWALHESRNEYLDSGIAAVENALFLNDLSRRELVNFETKAARAESRSKITTLGLKASVKAYEATGKKEYMQKIFSFIEESKGNIILDKFDETRARRHAGLPDGLLDTILFLKKELTVISDSMLSENSERFDALRRKYNDCFLAYNNEIALIEKNYPKYYQLKYAPNNVSLSEIQKALPPKSMLIQYSVGENHIYIAGFTGTNSTIAVAVKTPDLMHSLGVLISQLSDPDITEKSQDAALYKEFADASFLVYNAIMKPVLEKQVKTIDKLIIIPDGVLCYLPFEVLITGGFSGKGIQYQALPYLLKKYTISYDYSASLWKNNDSRYKSRNTYIGFSPQQDLNSRQLHGGKNEIKACSRIWKGSCFTGEDATEHNFKNASLEASIIQLATHTLLDDREPQKSCFEFAAVKDTIDDGLLYTYELYNMNIPAQLAILSSCETGTGHIRKGEGIISLARAFKYAGCPNIIMSLWKVNDLTASEVMIIFNRNLKKGMPKDLALQKAKLTYLKTGKNLHPAFWSSFVFIGNNRPLNHNYFQYYFIASFLLIFTVFIHFLRYKSVKKIVFRRILQK